MTPYEEMINREVRVNLDYINHGNSSQTLKDRAVIEKDRQYIRK